MSTSTILRPQTPSTERRPSVWLTLGVIVYAVAISVVLLVTSLSGHHHAAKATPGAVSSQTAEGRAAAEYVPPGLLTTPLTAEGRAAAEYVAPGVLNNGATDPICRPTNVLRVC
jgi:hypothetical protein